MASPPRGLNLHPANNLPSEAAKSFDVIVLGSGPSGRALAARTVAEGLSTAIVEEELVGGDCPFWACIPSKALLRPAEALNSARMITGAKELISKDKEVDVEAVFRRRDNFVQGWDDGLFVDLLRSQNGDIIRGTGRLIRERTVEIINTNGEKVEISANHAVVLATGSAPTIPNIPGLKDLEFWTPRHATSTNKVPKHLLILGAGVVGCEMATAFSSFGGKVTLISSSADLLPQFEPEAGKRVRAALETDGVTVLTSVRPTAFSRRADGDFEATLSNDKKISGSTVLLATGRKARIEGIGLDNFGVNDLLSLDVDDSLCVTAAGTWLYAIGDCNGRSPLTHMGVYQSRAAGRTIIARSQRKEPRIEPWSQYAATSDHSAISQVVVTDPNVASCGLTLAEAKKAGLNVKEVAVPFQFPGAWVSFEMNYDGWAQWVIDVDKEVLVGATFVGREASGLLHASTVAIVGKVPLKRLFHAVAPFPTMSEVYTALFSASGY